MKFLKVILLAIVIIIVLVLVIALFVKKEYTVQRQVVINQSPAQVFNYVKYLKNQDNYNKWVMQDPAMKKDFRGTDGTKGFVYAWDSDKGGGKGEEEITAIEEDRRIDMEIRFKKPMESVATASMETKAQTANSTLITWRMEGKSTYPMNFMNLFISGMLGKDMDSSLAKLKGIVEKQ